MIRVISYNEDIMNSLNYVTDPKQLYGKLRMFRIVVQREVDMAADFLCEMTTDHVTRLLSRELVFSSFIDANVYLFISTAACSFRTCECEPTQCFPVFVRASLLLSCPLPPLLSFSFSPLPFSPSFRTGPANLDRGSGGGKLAPMGISH